MKRFQIKPEFTLDAKLARLIPSPESTEIGYRRYAYSKLCNVLFAFKVHRDENKNGINTYVLHPGSMIGTSNLAFHCDVILKLCSDIGRSYGVFGKIGNFLTKPFTKNLEQGAATSVYCAVSPDVENVRASIKTFLCLVHSTNFRTAASTTRAAGTTRRVCRSRWRRTPSFRMRSGNSRSS